MGFFWKFFTWKIRRCGQTRECALVVLESDIIAVLLDQQWICFGASILMMMMMMKTTMAMMMMMIKQFINICSQFITNEQNFKIFVSFGLISSLMFVRCVIWQNQLPSYVSKYSVTIWPNAELILGSFSWLFLSVLFFFFFFFGLNLSYTEFYEHWNNGWMQFY